MVTEKVMTVEVAGSSCGQYTTTGKMVMLK